MEDVTRLHTCDATKILTFRLLPCRREIDLIGIVAQECRRIIGTATIEHIDTLDGISTAELPDFRSLSCSLQAFPCLGIVGQGVERNLILLHGSLIVAVLHEQAGKLEMISCHIRIITDGIAVSHYSLCRLQTLVVAVSHLASYPASRLAVLRLRLLISQFKIIRGIIILPQGKVFLTLLHIFVGATGRQQQSGDKKEKCMLWKSHYL